jgi:hypothetical protein
VSRPAGEWAWRYARGMRVPRGLWVAALVLVGLGAACNVNRVNRAALVPHMTPTLRSGAPMDTPAEAQLGASSLSHSTLGSSDDTAAVEVPGTQVEGAMRLRVGKRAAIGFIYAEGFDANAKPIDDTQPPVEAGNTRGYGVTISGFIPTGDERWSVGVNAELLSWSVPYVEYETCVQNCGGVNWTFREEGRAAVAQAALGIIPTYSTGKVNVWGGVTLRNHPTIEQKGTEIGVDFEDEVEEGEFNTVLSAGADIELGGGFRAGLTAYQVVMGKPAKYGPGIAAMITIPLGRRDVDTPPAPPVIYAPPPPAPAPYPAPPPPPPAPY